MIDRTLRSAWWRFVRLWRPMAVWTLLTWVVLGLILIPLTSTVVSGFFFRGERVVVGNQDLLAWLVQPEGIAYLVVAGALSVVAVVVRFVGLFQMVADDVAGRSVRVREITAELFPDVPALLRLCLATAAGALLLLAPLAGGLVAIYTLLLGPYDVNYYLEVQPPEWYRALVIAGTWILLWSVGTVYTVLRSLVTFPAYLDGHRPVVLALRESWSVTRGGALRMLYVLFVCLATWLILRATVHGVLFLVASDAAARATIATSLTPLLLVSAGYAAGTVLLDALLSFLGFSVVATLLTTWYLEDTDLHVSALPVSRTRVGMAAHTPAAIRRWLHPARAVPVLVAAGVLVVLWSGYLLSTLPEAPNVVVTAHRAGGHLATENTLAALEKSIEAGADYAEIDVQTTRDGVVVVAHDADLMRLAADPRRVAETDYDELHDVVLGRQGEAEPNERRLATLEAFIERARSRIGLTVELKYNAPSPALAERVVQLLRTHDLTAPGDVVIMALDLDAIRQVQRRAPEIRTGYVAAAAAGDLSRLPVDFLAVSRRLATNRRIRTAHRRGLEVHVWTINDPAAMLQMIERGVDGIITDDPALARRVIEELSTMTAFERLLLSFQPLLLDE